MNTIETQYRTTWDRVVALAAAVPEWDVPSPCAGWTARHLAGHLAGGADQLTGMLTGSPLAPAEPLGRAGPDPAATLRAARDDLLAVPVPDVVRTPHGPLPADQVLAMALIEPVVHGWDLATAAGLEFPLADDAVATLLAGVERLGGQLAATGMYAPAHPAPAGADPARRLLLALGRTPG